MLLNMFPRIRKCARRQCRPIHAELWWKRPAKEPCFLDKNSVDWEFQESQITGFICYNYQRRVSEATPRTGLIMTLSQHGGRQSPPMPFFRAHLLLEVLAIASQKDYSPDRKGTIPQIAKGLSSGVAETRMARLDLKCRGPAMVQMVKKIVLLLLRLVAFLPANKEPHSTSAVNTGAA